ncbi:MAG: CvpA family protein [Phycisphaerales bacterium]
MFVIFNILVIGLIALIAYWWGSQGVFSSLLHLVAVFCGGVVAFAVWEPLAMLMITKSDSSTLHGLAWGASLLLPFALSVMIFRVMLDKLIPNNLNFPHWADLSVGGGMGAVSGTIVVGMLVMGFGFIQSKPAIMGYEGYQRSRQDGQVRWAESGSLWYQADRYTNALYELTSVASMKSSRPLKQYSPDVYRQATLFRDTYTGVGQATARPDGITVDGVYQSAEDPTLVGIDLNFTSPAFDFGQRLTLTAAQVRLIEAPASRSAKPRVIYPKAWYQGHAGRREEGKNNYHTFDSTESVITNEAGKQAVDVVLDFKVPSGFSMHNGRRGAFLVIKGVRFELAVPEAMGPSVVALLTPSVQRSELVLEQDISDLVKVSNVVERLNASTNSVPAGMKISPERFILSGKGSFAPNPDLVSRGVRIIGFLETDGSRIVQVQITPGTNADIHEVVRRQLARIEDGIELIDDDGSTYRPIGFYKVAGNARIDMSIQPFRPISRVDEVDRASSSGTEKLFLVFNVTDGVSLTALQVGDTIIGTMNVNVDSRR